MKHVTAALLFVVAAGYSRSQEESSPVPPKSDSMESTFNSFVATYAKERVDWRQDIETTRHPEQVPPGRQLGFSKKIGYFLFTPKAFQDFAQEDRMEVINHPKFRAFIISLRNANLYPATGSAEVNLGSGRVTEGFRPSAPSYPVDGVPVRRTVNALAVDSTDRRGVNARHAGTTVPSKRAIHELNVTPEQFIQKKDLRVQLYLP